MCSALQRDDTTRFLVEVAAATPVDQVLEMVVGAQNQLQRLRRRAWFMLVTGNSQHGSLAHGVALSLIRLGSTAQAGQQGARYRVQWLPVTSCDQQNQCAASLQAAGTHEPDANRVRPPMMQRFFLCRLCLEAGELCLYGPARPPAEAAAFAAAVDAAAVQKLRDDGAPLFVDTPAALRDERRAAEAAEAAAAEEGGPAEDLTFRRAGGGVLSHCRLMKMNVRHMAADIPLFAGFLAACRG